MRRLLPAVLVVALVALVFSGATATAPPVGQPVSNALTGTFRVRTRPITPPVEPPVEPPDEPPVEPPTGTITVTPTTGGTTTLDGLQLTVPPGAVGDEVTFTVTEAEPGDRPLPGTVRIAGKQYVIAAQDAGGGYVTTFDAELLLSLPIPADATPDDLQVAYWDDVLGAWVAVPTTTEDGHVVGHLTHLTVFAVLEWPDLPRFVDARGHWSEGYVTALTSLDVIDGYEDGTFRPEGQVTRAELVKLLVTALNLPPGGTLAFSDELPHWALLHISAAVKAGIVVGYPDGSFRANVPVSRAEAATMLGRALALEAGPAAEYVDSIPGWALEAVNRATATGLFEGYPDNTFRPDRFVRRSEAAAIIFRALHLP